MVHEVLRSPGQALDAAARWFFAPRFGRDLSRVRVHTDGKAAESAEAVHALAYTVGDDVIFGADQYAPSTSKGRRLIAHELTHVAQQQEARVKGAATTNGILIAKDAAMEREADAVGQRAVRHEALVGTSQHPAAPFVNGSESKGDAAEPAARLHLFSAHKPWQFSASFARASTLNFPFLRRQKDARSETSRGNATTDTPSTQAARKPSESNAGKMVAELAAEVAGILKPTLTPLGFKRLWSAIEKQIRSPVSAKLKASGLQREFAHLFDATLVENLKALSDEERRLVAQDAYGQAIETLTGLAASDFTKEFNSLSAFVRTNIEGGIRGYVATRSALMNTFGSVAETDAYYKGMVQADFPSAASRVKGHRAPVHPNLQQRLQRGADVLRKGETASGTWLDITEQGISAIGGFNIRENRNKPTALSFHSFGWAIDIDAALNPNVETVQFPKALVEGFTGQDVYKGEAAKAIRAGGTAEELLPHARALRESSILFKSSLESEVSLKTAAATYLRGKGLTITSQQTDALFNLLRAGTAKNKFGRVEMQKWLSETKAAEETKPAGEPGAGPSGVARPPGWDEAGRVADLLIEAFRVFRGTTNKAGQKVSPSVTGTPRTIGAHGFLSLPGELIAALTGSDGGGLKWLGGIEKGTKDFMHFELKKADQPELPKDAAKSSRTKPEATKSK